MFSELANHGLVTGKLNISICQNIHDPYQRIKPMDTESNRQHNFCYNVKSLDMHKFMCQNIMQRLFIIPDCGFR